MLTLQKMIIILSIDIDNNNTINTIKRETNTIKVQCQISTNSISICRTNQPQKTMSKTCIVLDKQKYFSN